MENKRAIKHQWWHYIRMTTWSMNFKFAIRPHNKACNHKHNQDWNFRYSSAFFPPPSSQDSRGENFHSSIWNIQDSNFMHTHTTHNSTSNITYWHIYLNKFLTNQNNMWEAFLHTQLSSCEPLSFSPRSTYSGKFLPICSHSPIVTYTHTHTLSRRGMRTNIYMEMKSTRRAKCRGNLWEKN